MMSSTSLKRRGENLKNGWRGVAFMGFSRVAILMSSIALGSCEPGFALTVLRSTNGSVSLRVASDSTDFRACIDSASIYPPGRQAQPVWEIGRADPRDCVQQVLVGTTTLGFEQRSSAPLRSGRRYCAEVNGPGFSLRRGFTTGRTAVTQDAEDAGHC